MSDVFNMRAAIARLESDHLVAYLLSQDWETTDCEDHDRIAFLGADHGEGRYELVLPASPRVRHYRVYLQRAIYKLCGIEDRDPRDVLHDVFAEFARAEDAEQASPPPTSSPRLIRLRNKSHATLRVRFTSRRGEHRLLPDEAIEVALQTTGKSVPELECMGDTILIHDGGKDDGTS